MWTLLLLTCCMATAAARGGEDPTCREARAHMEAGRLDLALETLEKALGKPSPGGPGGEDRRRAESLRARCLFELGDFPRCERQLRRLLPTHPVGSPGHVECLAQLARVLAYQGAHDGASQTLAEAIRHKDDPALHRLAISLCLRARRHADSLQHANALLKTNPDEPFAHFVKGIALSREGQLDEALRELRWGLRIPDARRDAHFELALVEAKRGRPADALPHLLEILSRHPYDQEACYQASRQLIRTRRPNSMRLAAHLTRYFETLKQAAGPSSRDHHLQAGGHAADAAILRAAKWERLGDYERGLSEVRRALAVGRGDPSVHFYAVDFWSRMGMLAEAEAALKQIRGRDGFRDPEITARWGEVETRLAKRKTSLREKADTPLGAARLKLAQCAWTDASPHLSTLLREAVAKGDTALADRTARVFLARDARSMAALAYLIYRTATDPALLVPRIHFLTRFVEAYPDRRREREQLREARTLFLGNRRSGR